MTEPYKLRMLLEHNAAYAIASSTDVITDVIVEMSNDCAKALVMSGWRPPDQQVCARCGKLRWLRRRGLCTACERAVIKDGTIIDYPRKTLSIEDKLDFCEEVLGTLTIRQMADRLGIQRDSLAVSIRRAAASGNQRAIRLKVALCL